MIKLDVYNRDGKKVDAVEVDEKEFAGGVVRRALIRQAVIMYEANRRQGNASTKTVAQVAGSGKKPWRQKGTGWARAGRKRSPHWRGGAPAFGPKPRDYRQAMPRKARRVAMRSALLSRMRSGEVLLLEELKWEKPQTKALNELLKRLELSPACLIGLESAEKSLWLSARNISGLTVLPVADFNAWEVLRPQRLLLTRAAFERLRRDGGKEATDAG